MTVRNKLISSSLVMLLLFIYISVILVLGYRAMSHRASILHKLDHQEISLQTLLRGINEVILNEGTPDSIRIAEQGISGFDAIMAELIRTAEEPEVINLLTKEIDPKWKKIKTGVKPIIENQYLDFEDNDELMILYGSIITSTEILIEDLKSIAINIRTQLENKSNRVQYSILLSLLFALLFMLIHFTLINKSITVPIDELIGITKNVSNGVLSRRANVRSNDELGALSTSFNKMIVDLEKALISRNQEIVERKKAEIMTRKQLDHISSLRTIDQSIASSPDIKITLNVILEQVINRLHIDAASILEFSSYNHFLEYSSGKGFRTSIIKNSSLRLGEGYAGRAANDHQTLIIKDLKNSEHGSKLNELVMAEEFESYIAIPLVVKGKVMGVLEVFQRSPLEFDTEWMEFLETLAGQAAIAIDNASMFDNLHRKNEELITAYNTTIEGWSRALDYRDKETEGHSQRVTMLTIDIAREMGIINEELAHIRRGALLHDIGKLGVPDSILLKPGKLTVEEFEQMKHHTTIAFEIISPISFLRPALDIPYYHHEKWDGTGYPSGLEGDQIPLSARIFAIVDVWDALCSDRPYRPAWPIEKVLKHIRSLSGTHFDPEVVDLFFKMKQIKSNDNPECKTKHIT